MVGRHRRRKEMNKILYVYGNSFTRFDRPLDSVTVTAAVAAATAESEISQFKTRRLL